MITTVVVVTLAKTSSIGDCNISAAFADLSAEAPNVEVCARLGAANADANMRNQKGQSALHLAARATRVYHA